MADDDDVPPLEDMSEAFDACLKLREEKRGHKANVLGREVLRVPEDADKQKTKTVEKLLGNNPSEAKANVKTDLGKGTKKEGSNSFCGFKKGFFDTQKPKKNSCCKIKDTGESIPTIRKNVNEKKNVFPEVQEAINQQVPLLKSNEWMTEELLSKIMTHPKLSKQFTDPRFSNVIEKFQSNPDEIMRMCGSNPEMREFVQNFCAIMGQHFTELGEKQQEKPLKGKENQTLCSQSMGVNSDDEKKMAEILSDPEVSAILKTPDVQKLLKCLKEEPQKAGKLLNSADSLLRFKIQKLVDVGLLQMAF